MDLNTETDGDTEMIVDESTFYSVLQSNINDGEINTHELLPPPIPTRLKPGRKPQKKPAEQPILELNSILKEQEKTVALVTQLGKEIRESQDNMSSMLVQLTVNLELCEQLNTRLSSIIVDTMKQNARIFARELSKIRRQGERLARFIGSNQRIRRNRPPRRENHDPLRKFFADPLQIKQEVVESDLSIDNPSPATPVESSNASASQPVVYKFTSKP